MAWTYESIGIKLDLMAAKELRRKKRKKSRSNLRKWSSLVKTRDGKCLVCGVTEQLVAHHLLTRAEYPHCREALWNGVTLCVSHHRRMHPELPQILFAT